METFSEREKNDDVEFG